MTREGRKTPKGTLVPFPFGVQIDFGRARVEPPTVFVENKVHRVG